MSQDTRSQGVGNPGHPGGGQPTVTLRVRTPRGLWSMTEPVDAPKRPTYRISTKVQTVIDDARAVFKFVETDNQYLLFQGSTRLEPDRTLASYQLEDETLLVLSVQGGNACQATGARGESVA